MKNKNVKIKSLKHGEKYTVNGKSYNVTHKIHVPKKGVIPVIDIPVMDDGQWRELCLKMKSKTSDENT